MPVTTQELHQVVRLAVLAVAALDVLHSRPAVKQEGWELETYLTGCAHCERVCSAQPLKAQECRRSLK